MASASMMLHCGAREVTVDELNAVPCPPPLNRWRPVPHGEVLTYALDALSAASYEVETMKLGLARDDQRFWGTLVLKSTVAPGTNLAVAVASSLDKSTSLRWAYGHRVWICDNGAWHAEHTIAKKHTTHAVDVYRRAILNCVGELEQFKKIESTRVHRMMHTIISDVQAESFLMRAYQDLKILSPRTLPIALEQWRNPSVQYEGANGSAWQLFNAITWALRPRAKSNPASHAASTIQLGKLLEFQADPPPFPANAAMSA